MEQMRRKPGLLLGNNLTSQYPLPTILCALVLLYLAPFVSGLLVYPAFLLCLYRIFIYDARVFATDYCILIPVVLLFRTPQGMSLLVYLCLAADVWFVLRDDFQFKAPHVLLCLILNYMLLRMQWNISDFLLCFSQLFLMCVLLPQQDETSAERTSKLFVLSLLLSSVYALVFRGSSQMLLLRGQEVPAFWGSSLKRFQGLFNDPNFYMLLLVTAIALLAKLLDCGKIRVLPFLLLTACLVLCGVLTYSKTFFLALILFALMGIVWLFVNKKYLWGGVAAFTLTGAGIVLLTGSSIFSVVLFRFSSASDLGELTTGRTEVFLRYWNVLTDSLGNFFFGTGLADQGLSQDPHNLFLELGYYLGLVGLLLFACYYFSLLREMGSRVKGDRQNMLSKYMVLFMVLFIHFALHGILSMSTYAVFYLACLSLLLSKKKEGT